MSTATITRQELEGLPKKTLLQVAKEQGLELSTRTTNEDIIEAIMEAQEMEKLEAESEDSEDTEMNVVKTPKSELAKDQGKSFVDINELTVEDLQTLRPDLCKELLKKSVSNDDSEDKTVNDSNLCTYEVKLGPIGPLQVQATDKSNAFHKFMEQSGCTGYNKIKPTIKKIS